MFDVAVQTSQASGQSRRIKCKNTLLRRLNKGNTFNDAL